MTKKQLNFVKKAFAIIAILMMILGGVGSALLSLL